MRIAVMVAMVLAGMGSVCATAGAEATGTGTKAVAASNNAFGLDLFGKLAEKKGNLFFSPYSISSALAMAYAGARGDTAAQMAKTLHFSLEPAKLHPAFGSLTNSLNAAGKLNEFELSTANALWIQKGEKLLQDFLDLTKSAYGAEPHLVDFAKATEEARVTINRWVEEQTRDKIKELIQKGIVDSATVLVLTNAIYFKGLWAHEFTKAGTSEAPFTLASDEKVQVPTMHQKGEFGYYQGDGFQMLELPYKGEMLSMVFILPAKPDGLADLEKSLTAETLAKWLGALKSEEVAIAIPKFKATCRFRLEEALKSMGMPAAFSLPPADFSGITGVKDLFIGAVIHQAFVDVNEKGTEAAAATAIVVKRGGAPQPPKNVFRADHPFLFLLRDTRSGAILFMGRLMNPAGSDGE